MTTAADDRTAEDAFEAILAGRPTPAGAAGLAAFTGAVRASATSPGRPNAALADLLASGLLVDQSSPSARAARSAGASPSRASRSRIRSRTTMFFPALLAKVLSAGALAQAATGATVVVLAFAGAGAAGVLPGPVQDTFTSLVSDEDEAPVEEAPVYEPPVEETPVAEAPVEEAPAAEPPVETAPVAEPAADDPAAVVAAWMAEPIDGSFGSWVRSARHNPQLLAAIEATGRNFGYYVSHRAQQQGVDLDDLDDDGTVGHDRDGDRGPGRGNGDHRGDGRGPGDDRDGHRGGDDHRGGDRGGNDNRGPDRGHGRD